MKSPSWLLRMKSTVLIIVTDMKFVNCHLHTTFSNGDGFGRPEEFVKLVAEYGGTAIAATEHGNISSHVQLEKACTKYGIKPMFGMEAYTSAPKEKRKFHQTVIAMDAEGYVNLNRLVGKSYADGFYQWPTIHPEWWGEHANGLIVTSGCADSLLSCTLLGGKSLGDKREWASGADLLAAERVIRQYKEWFGDRYYLEVQRFPGLKRACTLNPIFAELGRKCKVPLVATADVHYPYAADNAMQRILHAAHRGGTVEQMDASWEYDITLDVPISDKQIGMQLMATGLTHMEASDAIWSTADIADRCTVSLPKNERIRYPVSRADMKSWPENA